MSPQKLSFLENDLFSLLADINVDTAAKWGKMNAQQMIEHLVDFFNVSVEKIIFPVVTPEEHLPKFKEFLLSDKQFRENTKAPSSVLGEDPLPLRCADIETAKQRLKNAVQDFIAYFNEQPGRITNHPAFGPLNYDEWIQLHYKHVTHHLRQFGIAC